MDARAGVDVKLEQQLGDALERHDKLRQLLRGRDPDVERAFDVLRGKGLLDPAVELSPEPEKASTPSPAGDDAMGIKEEPVRKLLEDNEAFKEKW